MLFEQLRIDGDKNLAYLVGDETSREVAVVDPGSSPSLILDRLKQLNARCVLILATHSHADHIAAVCDIADETGAPFAAYKTVAGANRKLEDGDVIRVGRVNIRVIFCPGHCADSVLLLCGDRKLLVGDELFVGGVGITRFAEQARLHYNNLHGTLLTLDDALEIYPGHDYGAKSWSTLGEQRLTNPYLLQSDFESFWRLRQNWKAYCRERHIAWG